METKELIERLRNYNDWRRGEHEEQPSPNEIGLWIDEICKKVDDQHDRIRELWEAVKKLNKEREEVIAERDILRIDAQRENEHHDRLLNELEGVYKERDEAREALQKIADCDFVITLPDRMDAVRKIANDALNKDRRND